MYWCSVLSIIFCSMFYAENWIVVRVELTDAIVWRCCFAIDCVVKTLLWECTWCFLYILVFALYVQNRKSFCHCRTQLRRCKSFKPCWLLANVKKNVLCLNYKHFEDMIRIVDVGFFLTQLVTVALLVLHLSYMRQLCF